MVTQNQYLCTGNIHLTYYILVSVKTLTAPYELGFLWLLKNTVSCEALKADSPLKEITSKFTEHKSHKE